MYEAFSQVLLGVWNDHCVTGDRAPEDMMRTGDPNKRPSLPFKAADDIPAAGKHVIALSGQSRAILGHRFINDAISITVSGTIEFLSENRYLKPKCGIRKLTQNQITLWKRQGSARLRWRLS